MNIVFYPRCRPDDGYDCPSGLKFITRPAISVSPFPPRCPAAEGCPGRRSFGEELRAYQKNCQTPCRLACSQKAGSQAATRTVNQIFHIHPKAALIYSRSPAFAFSHKVSFPNHQNIHDNPDTIRNQCPG